MLGTIGSAAPFIGLFGTVMGIIRAFHHMAIAGTGGFAVVAGGISEALIATALGLAVGIIAVVCYNYFQARVEASTPRSASAAPACWRPSPRRGGQMAFFGRAHTRG